MLDFILDLIKEFIKYFLRRFIPFCINIIEIDNKKHIYQKSGYNENLSKEYIDRIEKSKKEEIDRSWKK